MGLKGVLVKKKGWLRLIDNLAWRVGYKVGCKGGVNTRGWTLCKGKY